jgi:hypothetical protein
MIGFVAGAADVSQLPAQLLGKAAFLRGILIGSVHQCVLAGMCQTYGLADACAGSGR